MSFDLCNAPTAFEHTIKQILKSYLFKICLVYFDDVIIFGKSFEKMLLNLIKRFSIVCGKQI